MTAARTGRTGRAAALGVLLQALRGGGRYSLVQRLRALPRLVSDLLRGRYGDVDRSRLVGVGLGLLYVLSPVDVLPEVLLGPLGLADDAVVTAWLAGAVLAEVDRFLDWERTRERVVRSTVVG
ncbi:YkvA family protein [Aquipuribacter nitratireducens]|uniref:YkvA family protein n=1 Tax=Aquipuribacter nitratireducens TaxID=650104 RepID=A0ABW0GJT8_9MICO